MLTRECVATDRERPVFKLGVWKLPITREYISHDEINTETWPSRMRLVGHVQQRLSLAMQPYNHVATAVEVAIKK